MQAGLSPTCHTALQGLESCKPHPQTPLLAGFLQIPPVTGPDGSVEGGRGERPFSQLRVMPLTGGSGSTKSSSGGRGDMWLLILLRQLIPMSSRLRGTASMDSGKLTFPVSFPQPSNTLLIDSSH